MVRVPRNLDSVFMTVQFFSNFLKICRQMPLNSLCSFVQSLTLVVVDSKSFKIEESLHKMAVSSKSYRVEQKNHAPLARWDDLPLICDHLLRLMNDWSDHQCIPVPLTQFHCVLWSTFGLPRKFLQSLTLSCSFSHPTSLCLLHLWLLLSNTPLQKAFSLNAGATKEVTSPAAHRGIWHSAGVTKS